MKRAEFFDEPPRHDADPMEEVMRRNSRSQKLNLFLALLLFAGLIIYSLIGGGKGTVTAALDENGFAVTTLAGDSVAVAYADLVSVEKRSPVSAFERGDCVSGEAEEEIRSGTYENAEFGSYQLHVNLKSDLYLVAHLRDGSVLVFNTPSEELTDQIFEELQKRI